VRRSYFIYKSRSCQSCCVCHGDVAVCRDACRVLIRFQYAIPIGDFVLGRQTRQTKYTGSRKAESLILLPPPPSSLELKGSQGKGRNEKIPLLQEEQERRLR
jgi:hypothetical protein